MNTPTSRELKLSAYHRMLEGALGGHAGLALCEPGGRVLWSSDAGGEHGIEAAIAGMRERGFEWESDARGESRRSVDAERSLLYRAVRHAGEEVAWVCAMLRSEFLEGPKRNAEAAARVLDAIKVAVAADWASQLEADGLTEELARRYEELNLVYSLEDVGLGDDSVELRRLLHRVAAHMDVDLVAFVSRGGGEPLYAVRDDTSIPGLDLVLVQIGGNLFRFIAAQRQTVVINGMDDERRAFLLPHLPLRFLACPVTRGDVSGMLVLARGIPGREFENGDRSLAHVLGEQLGSMLRSQSFLRGMRRFGEQLAAALIEAVEAKDPYTRGHSERVQAIAVHLGQKLGLSEPDLQDLYWGAIMHDVGKLGVPDVILSKPGRLTEAEYTFIKTHPERSYEILRHIDQVSQNTLDGARYHHEHFEGGGYPEGRRGQEIPVHARVIAVADAYDAMTSSRSYRAAMPHDEAVSELHRAAPRQLDPEVVRAFASSCDADLAWLDAISFGRDRSG